jgi:hypothetical protein
MQTRVWEGLAVLYDVERYIGGLPNKRRLTRRFLSKILPIFGATNTALMVRHAMPLFVARLCLQAGQSAARETTKANGKPRSQHQLLQLS